jgi:branched-chain amino acid transport system permease protein
MINFAHGEFYMIGAYLLFFLYIGQGLEYWVAGILVAVTLGAAGFAMQRILRLEPDTPFETMILLTLGVSVTLQSGALAIFGSVAREAPTPASETILHLGPASISAQRVLIVIASIVIFLLLDYMLRRMRIGKAMRAVAQNQETATVVGIDIARISAITFIIGVGLAGVAGVLVVPAFFILPTMGAALIVKCFAAVIMGGRGNVRGAFVAAYALGIIESYGIVVAGLGFRDLFAFLLLLIVLIARPEGIFGKKANVI